MCALALALAAGIAGCSSFASRHDTAPPPPADNSASEDRDTTAAVLMGDTFQTMQRLAQAPPAEQAEILASARAVFERNPRGGAQLRYALLLATPGHAGRDPAMAQTLLRELAAQPETLVPIERAVALIELSQLDRELDLKLDNDRLLADTQRNDRERIAAAQRRLQGEVDENARLRKELDEVQAKLNAIASIERNLTEKKTAPEVHPQ